MQTAIPPDEVKDDLPDAQPPLEVDPNHFPEDEMTEEILINVNDLNLSDEEFVEEDDEFVEEPWAGAVQMPPLLVLLDEDATVEERSAHRASMRKIVTDFHASMVNEINEYKLKFPAYILKLPVHPTPEDRRAIYQVLIEAVRIQKMCETLLADFRLKLTATKDVLKSFSNAAIANWDPKGGPDGKGAPILPDKPYNNGSNEDRRTAISETLFPAVMDEIRNLEKLLNSCEQILNMASSDIRYLSVATEYFSKQEQAQNLINQVSREQAQYFLNQT
jgi:hypothetical protein